MPHGVCSLQVSPASAAQPGHHHPLGNGPGLCKLLCLGLTSLVCSRLFKPCPPLAALKPFLLLTLSTFLVCCLAQSGAF